LPKVCLFRFSVQFVCRQGAVPGRTDGRTDGRVFTVLASTSAAQGGRSGAPDSLRARLADPPED